MISSSFSWRLGLVMVALLASCGAATRIDGELDCDTEFSWTESGSVPDDTSGFVDPKQAIEAYLTPFQDNHGGEVTLVDEGTGSLVLAKREVVIGVASAAPAGGWLVLTGSGCDGFDRTP